MKQKRLRPAPRAARGVLLLSLLPAACYDFHVDGPEDPAPLPQPRSVSVGIEYRQPDLCSDTPSRCTGAVLFYGSWMRPGEALVLSPVAGRFFWVGTATGVPVNFPPAGRAHAVRVFDPYIGGAPSSGFTGRRLTVGGEALSQIEALARTDEHALVYVDDNGFGHNPY
jgi:hypothetical protein